MTVHPKEAIPELLPCPFCGGEAECYEYAHPPENFHQRATLYLWRVRCRSCYLGGDGIRKQSEAIAAWNRRAK